MYEHLSTSSKYLKIFQRLSKSLNISQSLSQFQNEDNKVSTIKGLISFKEAMTTVRAIRWKEGVFCPNCGSSNIKVVSLENDNYEYKCLDCERESPTQESDEQETDLFMFNDLTGLDIAKDMVSVIKWVLCIYLQVFLSAGKISK